MSRFKLALWVIILAVIALVIFQNQAFFFGSQSLRVNLWLAPEYTTPPIPNAALFLIVFAFGLLLAYVFGLPERMRLRRSIKKLNADQKRQIKEIEELKAELEALKKESTPETEESAAGDTPEAAEKTGPSTEQPSEAASN